MSENTPGTGERTEIAAADMSVCFHGTDVFIAKAAGTGENLIALRIKGHEIDPTGEVVELHPEIKTFEIILNPTEAVEILMGIMTGYEAIMGAELATAFEGIVKGEWN